MNHSHSDILIVGAGVFGLSTAYHLVRSGYDAAKVTILDRCPPPSNLAASTDLNKIVRADYTDPLYTELGLEAIAAWKSLPFFKNAGVYHQTGWVAMDEEGSDLTDRVRTNFRACGQEGIEELTQEEVKARWDGLLRDTDYSGFGRYYYNASAGWADAGAAVRVMADEVAKMGVRYCVGEAERVVLGTQSVQGVKVQTGEVYTANKVLLSTGAWTSSLMSPAEDELGIPDENRVESQITAAGVCVAHIQLTEEEKEMYNQLPVFVYGGQGEVIPPTASGILKFTNSTSFTNTVVTESGHSISVPPAGSQLAVPQHLQDEWTPQIRARLPRILDNGRQIDYFRICWDSVSPNQQPLITRHPDARLGNIYFAVGGSFHCWKFLPTIGGYVVKVLEGRRGNGARDKAWQWKRGQKEEGGVHQHLTPQQELLSQHPA